MARLLVVDDCADAARVLARLIKHHGHAVDVAYSGEDALSMLNAAAPDLVILDLMMPGIDGAEVLRRMRESPQTRTIPVAIFSAVADPAVRDHLLVKGAQDYWTKAAFDFQELGTRIDRLLAAGAA